MQTAVAVPHWVRTAFFLVLFLAVGGWAWLNGGAFKPGIRAWFVYFTLLLLVAAAIGSH